MESTSRLWKQITPSTYVWEREALDFVRERFPVHEPYRAWSNFEFIADDGGVYEVDLLLTSPKGFYLVEIKSKPGTLTGDAGQWTWEDNGSRRISARHIHAYGGAPHVAGPYRDRT